MTFLARKGEPEGAGAFRPLNRGPKKWGFSPGPFLYPSQMPLPAPQELRTYFVTAVTANRRRLFQVEANANLLLDVLVTDRAKSRYQLHAFVIMPDHLHAILTPAPEVSLEKVMAIHQRRILFPPQKQTRHLVSKLQRFPNPHAGKI
jgi:REP element-mobilizing transposase RayT